MILHLIDCLIWMFEEISTAPVCLNHHADRETHDRWSEESETGLEWKETSVIRTGTQIRLDSLQAQRETIL